MPGAARAAALEDDKKGKDKATEDGASQTVDVADQGKDASPKDSADKDAPKKDSPDDDASPKFAVDKDSVATKGTMDKGVIGAHDPANNDSVKDSVVDSTVVATNGAPAKGVDDAPMSPSKPADAQTGEQLEKSVTPELERVVTTPVPQPDEHTEPLAPPATTTTASTPSKSTAANKVRAE